MAQNGASKGVKTKAFCCGVEDLQAIRSHVTATGPARAFCNEKWLYQLSAIWILALTIPRREN